MENREADSESVGHKKPRRAFRSCEEGNELVLSASKFSVTMVMSQRRVTRMPV
jgi:hypothetical protein